MEKSPPVSDEHSPSETRWRGQTLSYCTTDRDVKTPSGQDVADDVAMDVGQAEVAALELVGQPLVLNAEQVQHGCVQVVNVHDVVLGVVPELVGRAVADAALDAAAGQPA